MLHTHTQIHREKEEDRESGNKTHLYTMEMCHTINIRGSVFFFFVCLVSFW